MPLTLQPLALPTQTAQLQCSGRLLEVIPEGLQNGGDGQTGLILPKHLTLATVPFSPNFLPT